MLHKLIWTSHYAHCSFIGASVNPTYVSVEHRKRWWHRCMCVGYGVCGVGGDLQYGSLFAGVLNERNCNFTLIEVDSQTHTHIHTHSMSRIWLVLPFFIYSLSYYHIWLLRLTVIKISIMGQSLGLSFLSVQINKTNHNQTCSSSTASKPQSTLTFSSRFLKYIEVGLED